MKLRHFICTLLAALMLLCLTACAGNTNESTVTETTAPKTIESEQSEMPPETVVEEESMEEAESEVPVAPVAPEAEEEEDDSSNEEAAAAPVEATVPAEEAHAPAKEASAPAAAPTVPAERESVAEGSPSTVEAFPAAPCTEHCWDEGVLIQYISAGDSCTTTLSGEYKTNSLRDIIGEEGPDTVFFHLYKAFRFACTNPGCEESYLQSVGCGYDFANVKLKDQYETLEDGNTYVPEAAQEEAPEEEALHHWVSGEWLQFKRTDDLAIVRYRMEGIEEYLGSRIIIGERRDGDGYFRLWKGTRYTCSDEGCGEWYVESCSWDLCNESLWNNYETIDGANIRTTFGVSDYAPPRGDVEESVDNEAAVEDPAERDETEEDRVTEPTSTEPGDEAAPQAEGNADTEPVEETVNTTDAVEGSSGEEPAPEAESPEA